MPAGADKRFDAESLLRSLMDNVPGAIYRCLMDDIWKMQRVSDEIESISGYPAADFVDASKRTLVSVTHPEDREPVDRAIKAAIAAGKPFALEYRVVHADGDVRWVLERGVLTIDRDGSEWLDGIIFDITERRASELVRLERETEAARIEQLEASRARIIDAADAARRRIERDLHDGAQQRLVVASLHLRAAERQAQSNGGPATLLEAARTELDAGLAELRELARGIHPTLLTTLGLMPAVQALAARCAVPSRSTTSSASGSRRRSRRRSTTPSRRRSRTSTAMPARRGPPCMFGARIPGSWWKSATTAAAAPTARAALACAGSRTGSARSAASSTSRARRAAARCCARGSGSTTRRRRRRAAATPVAAP